MSYQSLSTNAAREPLSERTDVDSQLQDHLRTMSVLSSAFVQALQQSHNEPTSPWSDAWGQSGNSSMTLDVSQSREDLDHSESEANFDIDVHREIDIDNSSQSSDKENVRPVFDEIHLQRRQNTDVGVDFDRHIDAWLDSVGKVIPLLATKAVKRQRGRHLTQPFLGTATSNPASLGGNDTG